MGYTKATHDAKSANTIRRSTSAYGPRRRDRPEERGPREGIGLAESAGINTLTFMNRKFPANRKHHHSAPYREGQKTGQRQIPCATRVTHPA